MKWFLLFVSTCLFVFTSFSQQHNNSVTLSLGPAFPVGKFASTNADDPNAGAARIGGVADLSYAYSFNHSNFGIFALARARINSIDVQASLSPLMKTFPGYDWPAAHKYWEAGAFMVGGYHSSLLTNKISIEEGLMFGVAYALRPAYNTTAIKALNDFPGDADVLFINSPKAHAITFSSLLKIGASLQLTNNISLVADIDYWYIKPTFKNVTQSISIANGLNIPYLYTLSNSHLPPSFYFYKSDNTQSMSSVNVTVGARLYF